MRKKLTGKRLLAVFLAVLMALTCFTALPFAASAATPATSAGGKYVFAYFTGNNTSEQKIRFAVSDDGYNFTAINGNRPVAEQTTGTGCARDPYLFRGQDGYFYMVATDMDASLGWWDVNDAMTVWRSADLVNWSEESHISIKDVKNADGTPALPANETVHCFWAPQVIWDASTGKYMVYFSLSTSSFTGGSEQKIYYMLTDNLTDVTHYSAPQLLYKNPNGDASIDADIMYDSANGIYYMYYKNEADGEKTIYYVSSTDLKDAEQYSACTPVKVYNSRSTKMEGCNSHFITGTNTMVMLADEYGNSGHYLAFQSTDFKNFEKLTDSQYTLNQLSPRHGSVLAITDEEYNTMLKAQRSTDMRYRFDSDLNQTSDWTYTKQTDSSGYTYEYQLNKAGIAEQGGKLWLNQGQVFVNDPVIQALMKTDSFTVSFSHTRQTDDNDLGTAGTVFALAAADKDFIRLGCDGTLSVYSGGTNKTAAQKVTVPAGQEANYTISYNGKETVLYVNGKLAASVAGVIDAREVADGAAFYVGLGYSDAANKAAALRMIGNYGNLQFSAASAQGTQSELTTQVAAFEALLQGGKLYTNASAAYAAYVQANRLLDAVRYGGADVSAARLKAATDALIACMAAMQEYTQPQMGKGYFGTTEATDGYTDVLYSTKDYVYSGETTADSYQGIGYVNFKIASPSTTVLLKNGDSNPGFPVVVESKKIENSSGSIFNKKTTYGKIAYVAPLSSDLMLSHLWYGYAEGAYSTWPGKTATSNNATFGYQAGTTADMTANQDNTGTSRFWNNQAFLNPTFGTNEYAKTYTGLQFTAKVIGNRNNENTDNAAENLTLNSTQYVLNYTPLANAVAGLDTTTQKQVVAQYKEGGLADLLAKADTVSGINPAAYNYAFDLAGAVTGYQADAAAAMTAYNAATVNTAADVYTNLRTVMDNCMSTYAVGNTVLDNGSTKYVAALWSDFVQAYQAAQSAFADLKDNDYKKDGSALQTLADNLQKAYDALCGYGAYEALDSAVSRVKTVVAAGKDGYYAADKYQALEQALTEVLATAYTNDGTAYALGEKQQTTIDACTAQLLSAYTDCMYSNRFKVTFIADGQTVSTDSYDANAAVTLTAPNATNGTWTVNGVTVAGEGASYTFEVVADSTVTFTSAAKADTVTVTNLSAFGDSVYSQYAVTADKTLSTVLAAAPARTLVGYHLDGWLVNGQNAAKLDGSLAVTAFAKNGTVLIKPVYSANAGTYTFDAPYTLTSNAADFLCWALPVDGNTYRVVSYSATYNCYATGAKSDFVAITQSNFNQYTLQGVTSIAQLQQKAPIASLRGAAEDASSQNGQVWNTEIGKLTFVAQYAQGTDSTYTVTACGLEFNNGTDGKGAKTVITKSNSQTDSCQYLISYTFSNPAGQTYSARSYVVYTDGQGQRHTSYSPWTNVTLAK